MLPVVLARRKKLPVTPDVRPAHARGLAGERWIDRKLFAPGQYHRQHSETIVFDRTATGVFSTVARPSISE